jgi:hypothetical protein
MPASCHSLSSTLPNKKALCARVPALDASVRRPAAPHQHRARRHTQISCPSVSELALRRKPTRPQPCARAHIVHIPDSWHAIVPRHYLPHPGRCTLRSPSTSPGLSSSCHRRQWRIPAPERPRRRC